MRQRQRRRVAEVDKLEVILTADDSQLTSGLRGATQRIEGFAGNAASALQSIGGGMQRLGGALTLATAPIALALGGAVHSAMAFDEALTNVGAVLGRNAADMAGLRAEILAIGETSRAGPQAVALAFYDIVGGVADATTHMDILNAAIATSEAGSADLTATTSALVSVMNAYGFAADQAAVVSDVLTRTVGMGVGSMDEFAAALPTVTGIAAQVGAEFGDVGAMMAFLTTQGLSASRSADYLRSAFVSLLNPNSAMESALESLGVASGSAALEQWGLAGTMGRLQVAMGGSTDALAEALGGVEALTAVMALNKPEFESFLTTFTEGIEGATDAARDIQMESAAAQFDLLKSKLQGVAIELGNVLLPAMVDFVTEAQPVVDSISDWIKENPKLAAGLVAVAVGAVVLGPILAGLGTIFKVAGVGISVVTKAAHLINVAFAAAGVTAGGLTAAFAKIVAVGAAVSGVLTVAGGIVAAYLLDWGGFRKTVDDLGVNLRKGVLAGAQLGVVLGNLGAAMPMLQDELQQYVDRSLDLIITGWDSIAPGLGDMLRDTFGAALTWVRDQIESIIGGLRTAIDNVVGAWQNFFNPPAFNPTPLIPSGGGLIPFQGGVSGGDAPRMRIMPAEGGRSSGGGGGRNVTIGTLNVNADGLTIDQGAAMIRKAIEDLVS
jgi:TP901 family phage tail tape measure protein